MAQAVTVDDYPTYEMKRCVEAFEDAIHRGRVALKEAEEKFAFQAGEAFIGYYKNLSAYSASYTAAKAMVRSLPSEDTVEAYIKAYGIVKTVIRTCRQG